MELIENLDPKGIADPALKLMIKTVRCYEGTSLYSPPGAGILAIFRAPPPEEDDPQRAPYSASSMQTILR